MIKLSVETPDSEGASESMIGPVDCQWAASDWPSPRATVTVPSPPATPHTPRHIDRHVRVRYGDPEHRGGRDGSVPGPLALTGIAGTQPL
jgi:hypothetical protein